MTINKGDFMPTITDLPGAIKARRVLSHTSSFRAALRRFITPASTIPKTYCRLGLAANGTPPDVLGRLTTAMLLSPTEVHGEEGCEFEMDRGRGSPGVICRKY